CGSGLAAVVADVRGAPRRRRIVRGGAGGAGVASAATAVRPAGDGGAAQPEGDGGLDRASGGISESLWRRRARGKGDLAWPAPLGRSADRLSLGTTTARGTPEQLWVM